MDNGRARQRQTRLKVNHTRRHRTVPSPLQTPPTTPPTTSRSHASSKTSSSSARTRFILSHFRFSEDMVTAYDAMGPLVTRDKGGVETCIPASYVRVKGPSRFMRTWMNRSSATHYLLLEPTPNNHRDEAFRASDGSMEGLLYPIHAWVMASQSLVWNNRIADLAQSELLNQEDEPEKINDVPVVSLYVPHLESMDALLMFLHSHDESALHKTLCEYWQDGSLAGQAWIIGFIRNVVDLGILDRRLRGVVWAVVEPDDDEVE